MKILITRFEGKCKYFTRLLRKVSINHRFRKPQGNTAFDFVIVLYMLVKRQDLIFFKKIIDFSKRQQMKVL